MAPLGFWVPWTQECPKSELFIFIQNLFLLLCSLAHLMPLFIPQLPEPNTGHKLRFLSVPSWPHPVHHQVWPGLPPRSHSAVSSFLHIHCHFLISSQPHLIPVPLTMFPHGPRVRMSQCLIMVPSFMTSSPSPLQSFFSLPICLTSWAGPPHFLSSFTPNSSFKVLREAIPLSPNTAGWLPLLCPRTAPVNASL